MAVDYIRKQIILEKTQTIQLNKIAEDSGVSFSELVRNFLNSQLRVVLYEEMEHACDVVLDDYINDIYLTEMTAIDGDEFNDGSK